MIFARGICFAEIRKSRMTRHVAQGMAIYDFSSQEIKMKRCLSIVFCLAFLSLGIAGNATADVMNGGFELPVESGYTLGQ